MVQRVVSFAELYYYSKGLQLNALTGKPPRRLMELDPEILRKHAISHNKTFGDFFLSFFLLRSPFFGGPVFLGKLGVRWTPRETEKELNSKYP